MSDLKARSLERGERRTARKRATKEEGARIVAAKAGPCRVCVNVRTNGHDYGRIEFHHLVPRSWGGDDIEDNMAPLHSLCHERVTQRDSGALLALAESVTDAEYAYIIGKLGEGGMERLFRV